MLEILCQSDRIYSKGLNNKEILEKALQDSIEKSINELILNIKKSNL